MECDNERCKTDIADSKIIKKNTKKIDAKDRYSRSFRVCLLAIKCKNKILKLSILKFAKTSKKLVFA